MTNTSHWTRAAIIKVFISLQFLIKKLSNNETTIWTGSPGEYAGAVKPKAQDVASKSLSGLESLVDQIPSIAEGPGGAAAAGAGPGPSPAPDQAPAAVAALPDYAPALYPPYGAYGGAAYGNNGSVHHSTRYLYNKPVESSVVCN